MTKCTTIKAGLNNFKVRPLSEAEIIAVDELRKETEANYKATQYQRDRASAYPSIADQLDQIYHEGIDAWKETIAAVKAEYPKP